MITLLPMSDTLFASYLDEAVAHFSKEYVIAGICSEAESIKLCRATYEKSLPQGVSTPDNYLLEIKKSDEDVTVGMAWMAIWSNSGKRAAFICDIYIRPAWRNKGFGTQTMCLLEEKAKGFKGVSELGLHVLWQNEVAQVIYKKLGFKPTGINMIKRLEIGSDA